MACQPISGSVRGSPWIHMILATLLAVLAGCDDDNSASGDGRGDDPDGGGISLDGGGEDSGMNDMGVVQPDADPLMGDGGTDMGPPEECTFDEECGPDLICEDGDCVDAECDEAAMGEDCADGFFCGGGRCRAISPRLVGGFCAGCGAMTSEALILLGGSTGEAAGTATSEQFQLEAGAVRAVLEGEED